MSPCHDDFQCLRWQEALVLGGQTAEDSAPCGGIPDRKPDCHCTIVMPAADSGPFVELDLREAEIF